MTSRKPPERPDDVQSEILQAVHDARNDLAPMKDTVEDQPVAETQNAAPRVVKADDVEVEIDRMEAYLRGPTAFTA
jgi:PHD/YefM family antitoxin component YafN of YafNO toxin-antitoxin module